VNDHFPARPRTTSESTRVPGEYKKKQDVIEQQAPPIRRKTDTVSIFFVIKTVIRSAFYFIDTEIFMQKETKQGAAVYSPLVLKLYDCWVLGISNSFAWQCPTKKILLPFFKQHVGQRHLDVGVGTGYYLHNTHLPSKTHVTLMDLNPNSLAAANARLNRASTQLIQHDVMTALPTQLDGAFDSISLFYLLHCLPGTLKDKSIVFEHLKHHIKPDGVLYGATILGDGANHNRFGQKLMTIYNKKGIFGNQHDNRETLEAEMSKHFADVRITVCGKVALFEGRQSII
jgi:SAM-dependent methyltransferase